MGRLVSLLTDNIYLGRDPCLMRLQGKQKRSLSLTQEGTKSRALSGLAKCPVVLARAFRGAGLTFTHESASAQLCPSQTASSFQRHNIPLKGFGGSVIIFLVYLQGHQEP